jgi:hypothetical protein
MYNKVKTNAVKEVLYIVSSIHQARPILVLPTDITRTQYTKCRVTPPEDEQVMLKTCRGP